MDVPRGFMGVSLHFREVSSGFQARFRRFIDPIKAVQKVFRGISGQNLVRSIEKCYSTVVRALQSMHFHV